MWFLCASMTRHGHHSGVWASCFEPGKFSTSLATFTLGRLELHQNPLHRRNSLTSAWAWAPPKREGSVRVERRRRRPLNAEWVFETVLRLLSVGRWWSGIRGRIEPLNQASDRRSRAFAWKELQDNVGQSPPGDYGSPGESGMEVWMKV